MPFSFVDSEGCSEKEKNTILVSRCTLDDSVVTLDNEVVQFLSSIELQGFTREVIYTQNIDSLDKLKKIIVTEDNAGEVLGPLSTRPQRAALFRGVERLRKTAPQRGPKGKKNPKRTRGTPVGDEAKESELTCELPSLRSFDTDSLSLFPHPHTVTQSLENSLRPANNTPLSFDALVGKLTTLLRDYNTGIVAATSSPQELQRVRLIVVQCGIEDPSDALTIVNSAVQSGVPSSTGANEPLSATCPKDSSVSVDPVKGENDTLLKEAPQRPQPHREESHSLIHSTLYCTPEASSSKRGEIHGLAESAPPVLRNSERCPVGSQELGGVGGIQNDGAHVLSGPPETAQMAVTAAAEYLEDPRRLMFVQKAFREEIVPFLLHRVSGMSGLSYERVTKNNFNEKSDFRETSEKEARCDVISALMSDSVQHLEEMVQPASDVYFSAALEKDEGVLVRILLREAVDFETARGAIHSSFPSISNHRVRALIEHSGVPVRPIAKYSATQ